MLALTSGCQRDQPAQAVPSETLTLSPEEQLAAHNRAVGLMGRFDYDGAVKTLEKLLDSQPQLNSLQVDLAIALLNRRQHGDTERSVGLLDTVLSRDSENLRAAYCRALLYFNNGEIASAKDLFQRVLTDDPDDAYARYYLAQCLLNEGNPSAALQQFEAAAKIDPYLRSAYYGAFQAAQRASQADVAQEMFQQFQRLDKNPRARIAELKYTRMGPKSELAVWAGNETVVEPLPEGPAFQAAQVLPIREANDVAWQTWRNDEPPPRITTADINGDGRLDLLVARGIEREDGQTSNAVLLHGPDGYRLDKAHSLAQVPNANTVLWGDYDDDGLVDAYFCCRGPNQLWRQTAPGKFENVTDSTSTSGGDFNTVDGACYDIDHDGDLDYLLVNANGPRELLSNNRNGAFQSIADELGIEGEGNGSRRVVIADFDADDDADLLFINNTPPHDVYFNDRLWNYHKAAGFDLLRAAAIEVAVAVDVDVNGRVEIYTGGPQGVARWTDTAGDAWQPTQIDEAPVANMAVVDCNGDGQLDLIRFATDGWGWSQLDGGAAGESFASQNVSPTVVVGDEGPAIVACQIGAPPIIWAPGRGRSAYALVQFSGKTDRSAEMRSNASGIGVKGVARILDRWVPVPAFRYASFPGQSLQPYPIGLAGASKVDFLCLLWPDSVSQTELDLKADGVHSIVETQRQAGSCPLVFVWDGEQFDFVADVIGAGGIGFNIGRGEYYPSRPEENLLLPAGLPVGRDGTYSVKLGEPMEEICYFDAVRLVAYDLPPGWAMTLDERFGGSGPQPTGDPIFYRQVLEPIRVTTLEGDDVTEALSTKDSKAAPIGRKDRRFVGVGDSHGLVFTFDRPLNTLRNPVVVMDGWVEYAYSQTAFAAWQAEVEYLEPTLEARGDDGAWRPIATRFGYPAGTSREWTIAVETSELPKGANELRISTNMQVYWDRLVVVDAEVCPDVSRMPCSLSSAIVQDVGFATRVLGPQRHSRYDYNHRLPYGDTRHPAGFYTAFGEASELVATADNALAIIGPGEELHLEFAELLHAPPAGWRRQFVLEIEGWCKDADLFTKDSGSVAPLPVRTGYAEENASINRRDFLHRKYNVRYRSGW